MNKILLTGATGAMGQQALSLLLKHNTFSIRVFVRNTKQDKKIIKKYLNKNIETIYGDLTNYYDCKKAVKDIDIILHVAALVSPQADKNPNLAMLINYGGTKNLIDSIINLKQEAKTKFVFIGSVAQTGDRMPPIHWGKIGDPLKPSVYDYYAVSKIAAERYLIESNLKYWVSLRQTGIVGKTMSKIKDPIMFHNCLNNVLEYVSDRDSSKLLENLVLKDINNNLDNNFWNNIYNIGGGEKMRVSTLEMFENLYKKLGFKHLDLIIDPKMYATRNFHGTYYLDSDKLNDYLEFRNDDINYYYNIFLKQMRFIIPISKFLTKFKSGEKLIAKIIKKSFNKLALDNDRGTKAFIINNDELKISAFWGSKDNYNEIPNNLKNFKKYENYDKIISISNGFDDYKDRKKLDINDMNKVCKLHGGKLLSKEMKIGDWKTKLEIECPFGHKFQVTPKLIIDEGHFCPECERKSFLSMESIT